MAGPLRHGDGRGSGAVSISTQGLVVALLAFQVRGRRLLRKPGCARNPFRAMMGETTCTYNTSEAHMTGIDGVLRHRG
jgi:hypothetical protein